MSSFNETGLTDAEHELIDVMAAHADGGSVALDVRTHEHEHPKLREIRSSTEVATLIEQTKAELRMPLVRNIRRQLTGEHRI